jgi:outer membrane usher protein
MRNKLFLILAVLSLAFPSYGQTESEIFDKVFSSKEKWVPVNIVFDFQELGEVPVKFKGNRPLAFLNLKKVLGPLFKDPSKLTNKEIKVSQLKDLGITLNLNEEKFYLELTLALSVRKESVTNFSHDYRPKWVKNESIANDFSFFSNFFYYLPYSHNQDVSNPAELDMEPNLNLYGVVLESSHTYKDDFVARKFTRAVYDTPNKATRLVVGDNAGPTTEFLSPIEFLGASYGKDFSLKPYDVTVPRGRAEFELSEPSTVKVFVNGSLIQILRLRAGKHNLEDLPLIQGLNEIKLVIESELGRVDEIIIPASFSQDLLKEGLSDFYYGVGRKSTVEERDVNYSDEDEVFTAFHRYGFTRNFTLGGFFQGDTESQLLGSDQVFSNELGQFKTQLIGSSFSSTQGANVKGEYYYLNRSDKGEAATGHLVGLEWRSPEFKLVGEENPLTYARTKLSYSYNSNIRRFNFRLGSEYEWNEDYRDTWNANATLGRTFARRLNINLTSNYKQEVSGPSTFDVTVFFNWYLSDIGQSIYGNYNSTGNNSQLSWQKLQTSAHDDLTYQVTGRNDDISRSMEADLNYNHHRVETGIRHTQHKSNGGNWDNYDGRVKLASAIGIVGGQFSIGRPVTDGFAIINRDEITRDQDIKINKSDKEYAFESDYFNNMMISKLQAYRYFHLRVDSSVLDDGLSLENEEFSLFPSYKSGILLSMKGKGSISAYGRLLLPNGNRLELQTFDVLDSKGEVIQRNFSNRKGRILIEGIDASVYKVFVEIDEVKYSATVDLSSKSFGLVDLKTIQLKRVSK